MTINTKYAGPCLYRGKLIGDKTKWGYSPLFSDQKGGMLIAGFMGPFAQIHKQTLCAWTGLHDLNGVKIFAGHIVWLVGGL